MTWDDLDHQLEDSSARAQLLRASSDFLSQTLGLTAAATAKTEPLGGRDENLTPEVTEIHDRRRERPCRLPVLPRAA